MGTTSVWLNVEEEEFIRRQKAIAATPSSARTQARLLRHLNPGEGVLAELRQKSELALDMLATLGRNARHVDNETDQYNNIEIPSCG